MVVAGSIVERCCYCKVVAVGRQVQLCLWWYGRRVDVIVRWLL